MATIPQGLSKLAPELTDQIHPQDSATASSNKVTPPTRLFDLPPELTSQITFELGYHDAVSFRSTCKTANALLPFEALKAKRATLKSNLVAAEAADYERRAESYANQNRWSQYFPRSVEEINNIHQNRTTRAEELNCYACLKTLPRREFPEWQVKGKRSLGHQECAKRFCIDCGWKKGIWEKGSVRGRGSRAIIVCRICGGLNKSDPNPHFKPSNPRVALIRDRVCSERCSLLHWSKWLRDNAETDVWSFVNQIFMRKALREQTLKPKQTPTTVTTKTATSTTSTGTRATRCMRCWAISHTEKPVATDGSKICTTCENEVALARMTLDEPGYGPK